MLDLCLLEVNETISSILLSFMFVYKCTKKCLPFMDIDLYINNFSNQ